MKWNIDTANVYGIGNGKNSIISKSLSNNIKEDKTIRIITKEVSDLILELYRSKYKSE